MAYADQEMSSSKMISIVLVVIIHLLLGYALVTDRATTRGFASAYCCTRGCATAGDPDGSDRAASARTDSGATGATATSTAAKGES